MSSSEQMTKLELPSRDALMLTELQVIQEAIRALHPLLDLLNKPEGAGHQLAEALREMGANITQIARMLEPLTAQNARLERIEAKLDRLLDGLEGQDGL